MIDVVIKRYLISWRTAGPYTFPFIGKSGYTPRRNEKVAGRRRETRETRALTGFPLRESNIRGARLPYSHRYSKIKTRHFNKTSVGKLSPQPRDIVACRPVK